MPNEKIVDREVLKEVREKLQEKIERGDIIAGKAQITEQIENVSPESGNYQEKPFLFQGTGTDSNTTETPTAPIAKHLELRGNTVVFYQLIDYKSATFTSRGVTFTRSGNGWVANNTATSTGEIGAANCYNASAAYGGIPVISGHKYLMGTFCTDDNIKSYEYISGSVNNRVSGCYIKTANSDGYFSLTPTVEENYTYNNVYFSMIFCDLTKMFGAGNEPTSVVQFNRLFPLPYYTYNAGQLVSCKSNKLVTIGYNQFNAQDEFIRVVAGQTYRLMYWNGTALTALTSGSIVEYAGDKTTVLKTTTYDNLSDLHTVDSTYPDNGDKGIVLDNETQYVKITGSSNTNILLNLAWDGSRSDYKAFEKHEYALPNVELKSAGSAYDSHYPDGTHIQRIGSVDLGTLDYEYNSNYKVFYAVPNNAKNPGNDKKANALCVKYNTYDLNRIRHDLSADINPGIAIGWTNAGVKICIRDDSFNADTTAFKTAMSGVILYYELAAPIETQGTQFIEQVQVDDFGTMEFTTSETESVSNPIIPQGNRFFYPADYVLLMDDLNSYTDGDVQVLAKKSEVEIKQDKLTQSTDLTPTTQTLTLSANTRYALGTLTALDLTFPTTNVNDGDEIIVEFVSGSTATTLTLDNVNAIYNFNSVNLMSFVELSAKYSVSMSKWVVNSHETISISPILENNSWATIKAAFKAGVASQYWSVGDEKTVSLSDGYTYKVRIADMTANRYKYSNDSGYSNNVFEFVECLPTTYQMNSTATNVGGFTSCEFRTTLNTTIFNSLPTDLREVIAEVRIASSMGNASTSGVSYSYNLLFLEAEYELTGVKSMSIGAEEGSPQFGYWELHNSNADRIKTKINDTSATYWWLRSTNLGVQSFCSVDVNGTVQGNAANNLYSVCPCFVL